MRAIWISYLEKIVFPVLNAAAGDHLKESMPVYHGRREFQYLEAVGRIVCGMGSWLNSEIDDAEEAALREKYMKLTVKAISNLVNPNARDYIDFSFGIDFGKGGQTFVNTAYLSQGILRAPNLWKAMGAEVQNHLLREIKKTRQIKPPKNNWLLFASTIEAFLLEYDNEFDKKRLYYGVKKFINSYYVGDGIYSDGASLSMDYYNGYVIHPMLIDVLKIMNKYKLKRACEYETKQLPRYKRYVEIQERMISPEGAYPIIGRTLICRFGAFHALAQAAFLEILPSNLMPAQVRCGLNAVLKRHMETTSNFDSKGFMTIGFNGKQDKMAENYVTYGSPYHCTTIFLPLGLSRSHPFWADDNAAWTSLKAFSGEEFESDKAFHEINATKEFLLPLLYKCQSALFKIKNVFRSNQN